MKVEDVEKAIDLLYEYHKADELLKKAEETHNQILFLHDKINDTNNEVEKYQYRKEIVDIIQKLILNSKHNGCNFEHDVLMFGLGIATTRLEYKIKELKYKIEQL